MMNSLFSWMSTKLPLGVVDIPYPDFVDNSNAPDYKDNVLSDFYTDAPQAQNPGREAVNFYEAFSNYLTTTKEIMEIPRILGALLGQLLWYVAEALRFFYIKLFALLRIGNVTDYASKGGYNGGKWGVRDLYHYGSRFGLFIFGFLLLLYVIGTTINSPTYQRYKNILRNSLLIIFFLVVLPGVTSNLGKGVGYIAHDVLDPNSELEHPEEGDANSDLGNLAFRHNVVSLPIRMEQVPPGGNVASDDSSSNAIVRLQNGEPPIKGLDGEAQPVYINMAGMSSDEADDWNGMYNQSVPDFLKNYASDNDVLNKQNIGTVAKAIGNGLNGKGKQQIDVSSGSTGGKEAAEARAQIRKDHQGSTSRNFFARGITDAFKIGDDVVQHFKLMMTASDFEDNYKTLFSYDVESEAPQVGSSGVDRALSAHSMDRLSGMSTISASMPISKDFVTSYGLYHVNWLAIYGQLIMIIVIMGGYIFKLVKMVFKLGVMYVSSGLVLFRNADNYQRVKNWMRDLFSIYEMAIMDVIMMYVSLYIIYPAYHQFNQDIMVHSHDLYLANNVTIALVNIMCDVALFFGSMKGVNAVNSMAGSTGGGANSGAGMTFGQFMTTTVGLHGGAKALKLGGKAVSTPFHVAGSFMGTHGKNKKGHFDKKGDDDSKSANSNRKPNNKNGGLNSSDKTGQNGGNNTSVNGSSHNSKPTTRVERNQMKAEEYRRKHPFKAAVKNMIKSGFGFRKGGSGIGSSTNKSSVVKPTKHDTKPDTKKPGSSHEDKVKTPNGTPNKPTGRWTSDNPKEDFGHHDHHARPTQDGPKTGNPGKNGKNGKNGNDGKSGLGHNGYNGHNGKDGGDHKPPKGGSGDGPKGGGGGKK